MIVDLLLIACLIVDVVLLVRAARRTPHGLDWFDVPPPVPVDRKHAAPTDFDS